MRRPEQIKPKSMAPRRNSFFIPGADAYDVDVSASTLCRFRSHSTQNVSHVLPKGANNVGLIGDGFSTQMPGGGGEVMLNVPRCQLTY